MFILPPMRTLLLAAFAVLLAGCGWLGAPSVKSTPDDPIAVRRGEPFWLTPGQTAATADGAMLTFEALVDESRCPEGVACVWGGVARISVVPSEPNARYRVPDTLSIGEVRAPGRDRVGPFRLLDLLPHPRAERPQPPQEAYRAQFVIE